MPLRGVFLVLFLVALVIKVFALIDCIMAPERAFVMTGKQTKVIWLAILAAAVLFTFGSFLSVIGLVAALVYLLDVRPAVRQA
jgi:hypothetical protein